MKPREVFFSHASANRRQAERVIGKLREAGHSVWYSRSHIKGAQQWQDEIGQALRRCDWFVLLLSPQSVESKWVKRELSYALSHDQYDGHIVPLVLKSCDHENLSWTLGAFQMLDLRDDGLSQLLSLWASVRQTKRARKSATKTSDYSTILK